AVLPLARRAVQRPRRRGDPELGDRGTRRGEAQFGGIGQVADDRDGGFSCHRLLLVSIRVIRFAHPYDRSWGTPYVSGRPAGSPCYAARTRGVAAAGPARPPPRASPGGGCRRSSPRPPF